jgi:hypothetical protein
MRPLADPPAQALSSGGQSPPVVIGQPKASATELAAKEAVLIHQVGENLSFASVEPTGEDEQQKLEGREVDHGASLFRANRRRLSDGTVRDSEGTILATLGLTAFVLSLNTESLQDSIEFEHILESVSHRTKRESEAHESMA